MKLGRFALTGYALGLVIGLGLVATYGAMEVSSTPAFCGSCHIMEPYYDSWVTSSHAEIPCVDCHIPPGLTAELEKKYEALSMVARYFTGTYGTNPWAEIDDAACLGCHERRLLVGRELYSGVLFDHGPHMTELRRGKRLRCTSCHSQIVQGSHMTVTATTCTLCHFKGEAAGQGTAACDLCHETPSVVVDADGLEFDHGDVERFGMDCLSCHPPPAAGAGGVPRERCLTCHNDPVRLAEYDDGELLHRTHVTDHKVECTNCHLELEHVPPRHPEASRSECDACHRAGHSPQRELYAGIGGQGVPPMPDVMFRAGVRCEGCHLHLGHGETAAAGEVSCMSCHGPGAKTIFEGWSRTLETRVTALRRQLDDTARRVGSGPRDLEDARANLELVERGRGLHNVPYSLALLDAAHAQLNRARGERGLAQLATPWSAPAAGAECLTCHAGAEVARGAVFGRRFDHRPHVVAAGLECESCHRGHDEREATGAPALKLGAGACDACHHRDTGRDCASCHAGVLERTIGVELGEFDHRVHLEDFELGCADCHGGGPRFAGAADAEICSECH